MYNKDVKTTKYQKSKPWVVNRVQKEEDFNFILLSLIIYTLIYWLSLQIKPKNIIIEISKHYNSVLTAPVALWLKSITAKSAPIFGTDCGILTVTMGVIA